MLKDPDAVLDFVFDWSDWLEEGESIDSYDLSVSPSGSLAVDSDSESSGVITVWLSGGTARNRYLLSCKITTDCTRIDERSMDIVCRNR